VFYLPSHLFTALAAGAAVCPVTGRTLRVRRNASWVAACVVLLYAGWRGWDTWPVVDRHDDRRAEALVTRLTLGLDQRNAVLVTNLNWQIENVLLYYTRFERRDIAWVRLPDVRPHFPFLVKDNEAISRDVVMDAAAARDVTAAYGGLFAIQPDQTLPSPGLRDLVSALPAGTPYVLSVLTPPREEYLDPSQLASTLEALTGTTRRRWPAAPSSGGGNRWRGACPDSIRRPRSEPRFACSTIRSPSDGIVAADHTFRRPVLGRAARPRTGADSERG
jgi:hypothetical protein